MKQNGKVRFKLIESDGTRFSIALEPQERTIDVLGHGFFMFELRPGITFEQGQALAKQLNETIAHLMFLDSGRPFVDTPDEDSGVRH